jgi:hypothetical protein
MQTFAFAWLFLKGTHFSLQPEIAVDKATVHSSGKLRKLVSIFWGFFSRFQRG